MLKCFDEFVEKSREAKKNQKYLVLTLFKEGQKLLDVKKDFVIDASKGKYSFTVGSNKSCDIFLNDFDIIDDFQCTIDFQDGTNSWYIREEKESLNGSYICCKNYQELVDAQRDLAAYEDYKKKWGVSREKLYKPSRKQLLQRGMLIYMSDHVLEVL